MVNFIGPVETGLTADNTALGIVPENVTPTYRATLVTGPQNNPTPIPASQIAEMTLSIVNTSTGLIINNCNEVNILNTGRGSLDDNGNLVIILETGDTSLSDTPTLNSVERSLIIDWLTNGGQVGRREAPIIVQRLSGP